MGKKTKVRIGRLDSLGGVCSELARVYRLARRGEMEMAEAKGLPEQFMDFIAAPERFAVQWAEAA